MNDLIRTIARVSTAAVAAGAAGLLGLGGTAQASPSATPVCAAYAFNPGPVTFDQAGILVAIDDGARFPGPAHFDDHRSTPTHGQARGAVTGRSVDIWFTWDPGVGAKTGSWGHYTGVVNGFGYASGTGANSVGAPLTWRTLAPLRCTSYVAPPPQASNATVTADVDVYAVPGGGAGAHPTGRILRQGSRVHVNDCRADNWCEVAPHDWVFGTFLQRDHARIPGKR